MINCCIRCGLYRADRHVAPDGSTRCPQCGNREQRPRLPLLLVGGASGAGKSTVCHALTGAIDGVIPLEADVLWRPELASPADNYGAFVDTWLRLCKNIHYSGRPVVLFGAGFAVPENVEGRVERRYFSTVHYLALVCDDDELTRRLEARPAWRAQERIGEQLAFNRYFRERRAAPVVDLIDTTAPDLVSTVAAVGEWITEQLTENER